MIIEYHDASNVALKLARVPPTYTLTVQSDGTGSGTVGGGGTFPEGAWVLPTATADPGSTLVGWTPESCAESFLLEADTVCTATFSLDTVTVIIDPAPTGGFVTDNNALSCGEGGLGQCSVPVTPGDNLTLEAVPAADQTFVNWTGDCVGTDNPLAITVNTALSCSAVFAPAVAVAIPTLSTWAMVLLGAVLAMLGMGGFSRQRS